MYLESCQTGWGGGKRYSKVGGRQGRERGRWGREVLGGASEAEKGVSVMTGEPSGRSGEESKAIKSRGVEEKEGVSGVWVRCKEEGEGEREEVAFVAPGVKREEKGIGVYI